MGKRKVAALDLGALQVVEIDEAGVQFQTGVPVTMRYIRNVQPAPYFGDRFQQDIEPAGRYLMHLHWDPGQRAAEQGWEVGKVTLHAPLVLSFTTDGPEAPTLYGPGSWKARLHQALSASGCKLTKALRTAGFDSIVTVWLQGGEPSHTKEIVLLPEKCADKVRPKRNPSLDVRGHVSNPRPIPLRIDPALEDMVDDLFDQVVRASQRIRAGSKDVDGLFAETRVDLVDASGKKKNVKVGLRWVDELASKGKARVYVGGAMYFGRLIELVSVEIRMKPTVSDLGQSKTPGYVEQRFKRELRGVLSHELTHAAEPRLQRPRYSSFNIDLWAHTNDPQEARANVQMIVQEVSDPEAIEQAQVAAKAGFTFVNVLVALHSPTWERLFGCMTDDTKRKTLSMVERALRDQGIYTGGYGRLPTQSRTETGATMFANPSKAMVFGELEVRKEKGQTFGVWHMLLNDWVIRGLPQESAMDAAALFSGEEGEKLLLRWIGDDPTAKAEIERMQYSPHVIPKRLNLDKELVIPYQTDAKGKWNARAPQRKAKIAVVRRYGDWFVHRRPNFEVPIDEQGFVQPYVDDKTYVVAYKDGRSARVGLKRDTAYLLAEQLDGPWANMAQELLGGHPSEGVVEELSQLMSDLVAYPAKYRKPKREVEPKEVEDWIEIENDTAYGKKLGKLVVERRFGNWVVTRAVNYYAPQDERGFFKPGKGYDVRYKDGRTLQVSLPKATAYLLARHMNGPWSEVGDMLVGITGHDSEKVSEVAMHVRALIKDPKSYKL